MLLVHQSGYVRVGEVVRFVLSFMEIILHMLIRIAWVSCRYTLTYTPSLDQILPTPTELHVKVKNTSAIPLRAAYLHGPYTLYTACYPSEFDPNQHYYDSEIKGVPQYEPYLKAGGSWTAKIPVPEETRLTVPGARHGNHSGSNAGSDSDDDPRRKSITWVIEITSQVIFSSSAAVHFELLVGRDPKSLEFGINGSLTSSGMPPPAHINEHQILRKGGDGDASVIARKGVFSKSVTLVFDDIRSLWSSPECSTFTEREEINSKLVALSNQPRSHHVIHATSLSPRLERNAPDKKKRRIHLVILTHGLHGNLGADMLYLKESIDAAAEEARRAKMDSTTSQDGTRSDEEEDEEVIVRGFPGNVTRTERGIQYLGKRLAKYVLLMTYPDQPYLPTKKKMQKNNANASPGIPIDYDPWDRHPSDCQVTSISFIGHSLGGLIQTYAIAYIQKHSPEFFERIKPINFVALATPFLGLSNENPVYVRFALDLGLVGKTGQDLGLSWMSPRVRSRWDAIISKFAGNSSPSQQEQAPASKPLLRILPAGPAHQVLQRFRNRTVYSNVVNDGIVPLRTSCLLFLDWRGLDRVQKARRGNGLVGTMAEWGWAELTGANSISPTAQHHHHDRSQSNISAVDGIQAQHHAGEGVLTPSLNGQASPALLPIPSPAQDQILVDNPIQAEPEPMSPVSTGSNSRENPSSPNPFNHFFGMFHSKQSRSSSSSKKSTKIIRRSQTLAPSGESTDNMNSVESYPPIVRGNSLYDDEDLSAPPRTTIFESAGDVLRPPLPPTEFITDPTSRPRTIFHDRIYHPEDIPPPILKKRGAIFSGSRGSNNDTDVDIEQVAAQGYKGSGLRVEEKIARAYHQGLSWRKVLVRMEPDAHNNIIVRRMFSNAYGWPVVKHLVDNHFGNTYSARTEDALESNRERAKPLDVKVTDSGEETYGQSNTSPQQQQLPFRHYATLPPEIEGQEHSSEASEDYGTATRLADIGRQSSRKSTDSAKWTDRYFSGGDSASEGQSDHEELLA